MTKQEIKEILGACKWLVETHTEKDGSFCDTGRDMEYACRSQCVGYAIERLDILEKRLLQGDTLSEIMKRAEKLIEDENYD